MTLYERLCKMYEMVKASLMGKKSPSPSSSTSPSPNPSSSARHPESGTSWPLSSETLIHNPDAPSQQSQATSADDAVKRLTEKLRERIEALGHQQRAFKASIEKLHACSSEIQAPTASAEETTGCSTRLRCEQKVAALSRELQGLRQHRAKSDLLIAELRWVYEQTYGILTRALRSGDPLSPGALEGMFEVVFGGSRERFEGLRREWADTAAKCEDDVAETRGEGQAEAYEEDPAKSDSRAPTPDQSFHEKLSSKEEEEEEEEEDKTSNASSNPTSKGGRPDQSAQEQLQMWKTEYARQRLFVHRLSCALLANGVRVGIDYTPSPLPGIKHQFVDVNFVRVGRQQYNVPKASRKRAPGPDQELVASEPAELRLHVHSGAGSSTKPSETRDVGTEPATTHYRNSYAMHFNTMLEVTKGGLSQQDRERDLEELVKDPKTQGVLRDVIIMELSRHGILVDAQFNNTEILLRLTGLTSGGAIHPAYLDRIRRLLLARTSSFGQDLRGAWVQVQRLLAEKAAWFREPYPFTSSAFDIAQDPGAETCTATLPGSEGQFRFGGVGEALAQAGIPTTANEDGPELTFEGVADEIDCIGIAISCALLYKKAVLKLDKAFTTAYQVTFSCISDSEYDRNTTNPKEHEGERGFYECFRDTLADYRAVVVKRMASIDDLLADYEEKKRNACRLDMDMDMDMDVEMDVDMTSTGSDYKYKYKDLLSDAIKNAIAAREAESFHAQLVHRVPPLPSGSHAEKWLHERVEKQVAAADELRHEAALREVQIWGWRAKHEALRGQLSGAEERLGAEASAREQAEATWSGVAKRLMIRSASHRAEAEELSRLLEAEQARARDLELQLRTRDADYAAALQNQFGIACTHADNMAKESHARGIRAHEQQQQQQEAAQRAMVQGVVATIRVVRSYPIELSAELGVGADDLSAALCRMLRRRDLDVPELAAHGLGKPDSAIRLVEADLRDRADAEKSLMRRTREVAKLRATLGKSRRQNEWLLSQQQQQQKQRQRLGHGVEKKHRRRADADAEAELARLRARLAEEKETNAKLEGEIEDLANLNNALEIQIANHRQVTEIQRGKRTSLVRPRSNTSLVGYATLADLDSDNEPYAEHIEWADGEPEARSSGRGTTPVWGVEANPEDEMDRVPQESAEQGVGEEDASPEAGPVYEPYTGEQFNDYAQWQLASDGESSEEDDDASFVQVVEYGYEANSASGESSVFDGLDSAVSVADFSPSSDEDSGWDEV